jgi:hypothetical protein
LTPTIADIANLFFLRELEPGLDHPDPFRVPRTLPFIGYISPLDEFSETVPGADRDKSKRVLTYPGRGLSHSAGTAETNRQCHSLYRDKQQLFSSVN